ncbi:MAG: InlB B-repeat-containing protein, partial [Streptococcus gallolyticus]|nr:InlB B-repeat-containing protein [Streptococcus gallolyticus]
MSTSKQSVKIILSLVLAFALIIGYMPSLSKAVEEVPDQPKNEEPAQEQPSVDTQEEKPVVDEIDPTGDRSFQEVVDNDKKSNEEFYLDATLFPKENFSTGVGNFSSTSGGVSVSVTDGKNFEGQKTFKINKGGKITFTSTADIEQIRIYASNIDNVDYLVQSPEVGNYISLYIIGSWTPNEEANDGVKTVTFEATQDLWLYGCSVLSSKAAAQTSKITIKPDGNEGNVVYKKGESTPVTVDVPKGLLWDATIADKIQKDMAKTFDSPEEEWTPAGLPKYYSHFFSYFTANQPVKCEVLECTFAPGDKIPYIAVVYLTRDAEMANISVDQDTELTYHYTGHHEVKFLYGNGFDSSHAGDNATVSLPADYCISSFVNEFTKSRFNIEGLFTKDMILAFMENGLEITIPIIEKKIVDVDGLIKQMEKPNNGLSYFSINEDVNLQDGSVIKKDTPIYDPMVLMNVIVDKDFTVTLNCDKDFVHLQFEQGDGVTFSRLLQSFLNSNLLRLKNGEKIDQEALYRVLNECTFTDPDETYASNDSANYGLAGFYIGDDDTLVSLSDLLNKDWSTAEDFTKITIVSEKKTSPLSINFVASGENASAIDAASLPTITDVFYANYLSNADYAKIAGIKIKDELASYYEISKISANKDIFYVDQDKVETRVIKKGENIDPSALNFIKFTEDVTFNVEASNTAPLEKTVTFDSQGGSEIEAVTVELGSAIEKPADPTKDGYVFAGWFLDKECTPELEWDFENYVVEDDMTLYAKWNPATYTVVLNTNEGVIAEGKNVTTYTFGVGAKLPTATEITKEGFTFGGWFDNEKLEGNAVTEILATDKGNKTYWAKWTAVEPNPNPVNPDDNGGSGSSSKSSGSSSA